MDIDSLIQPRELPTCFSTNETYKCSTLNSGYMYAGTNQDWPINTKYIYIYFMDCYHTVHGGSTSKVNIVH